MIVLVDIGNSRSKFTFLVHGLRGDIKTIDNVHFNEDYFCIEFKYAKQIVVASVSKDSVTATIENWCHRHQIKYKQVYSEKRKGCVISAYENPEQLGVDRWLAVVAANKLYPNMNILVVDAGTATTIDLLTVSGKHQGGWILPGIDALFNSVIDKTSKVMAEPAVIASTAFGTNTSENVNNACWAATVGAIDVAINQAQLEFGTIDKVIITGGNSLALAKIVKMKVVRIEDLIFYGLESYC